MPGQISRRELGATIAARLVDVTHAIGYYGQIGAAHGLPDGAGGTLEVPEDPPAKAADDLRVQPYFVIFPGIGAPGDEGDLADTYVDLDWPFQVTVAGGDVDDVLALTDRVDARLFRWSPGQLGTTDAPVLTGRLRHPVGYVPQLLPDRSISPMRWFAPLQYVLTAHT